MNLSPNLILEQKNNLSNQNQTTNEKAILYVLVTDTVFSNGIFANNSQN
jgi:hypothetical protein